MALDADLQVVCDAVTNAATDTIRTQAMVDGMINVLVARMGTNGAITAAQTCKIAQVRANCTTNVADFVTAFAF